MDAGQDVALRLVVVRGDGPERLALAEAALVISSSAVQLSHRSVPFSVQVRTECRCSGRTSTTSPPLREGRCRRPGC